MQPAPVLPAEDDPNLSLKQAFGGTAEEDEDEEEEDIEFDEEF